MKFVTSVAAVVCLAGGVVAQGVSAAQSADAFRMALQESVAVVDPYIDPKPEMIFLADGVYDGLVAYDEGRQEFAPLLAASWQRISPTVLRFNLRQDVKWHDGKSFGADDVVHTIEWVTAPETKLRFKSKFEWIKGARKLDDHTVEIEAKNATPSDLPTLALHLPILPKHVHGALEDKSVFGRHPIGTGMYKVDKVDPDLGVTLEKNPDYNFGGSAKPASNVSRIEARIIPDQGTQTAELVAGNLDMVRAMPHAQATAMAASNPDFAVTVAQSISYTYMLVDALARSGNKPLADLRVRKALMHAVNTDALKRIRTGGKPVEKNPPALCWEFQTGCSFTVAAPSYDPELAKKLLEQAGYPDGFPVTITTMTSIKDYAEFVAGDLRAIGIEANVSAMTFPAFEKARAEGTAEIIVAGWNAGISPDSSDTIADFFKPSARDSFGDKTLQDLATKATATVDEGERKALVSQVLDRATTEAYARVLVGIPVPILHNAKIVFGNAGSTLSMQPYAFKIGDINWK